MIKQALKANTLHTPRILFLTRTKRGVATLNGPPAKSWYIGLL
uniref:Uncharacterized protein n=1 Tax=Arundo donax TaxID=35708 RepID=A0A0A9GEW8_ARUDO